MTHTTTDHYHHIAEGLAILHPYDPHTTITIRDNNLYAGPEDTPLTDTDEDRLTTLGWTYDHHRDRWYWTNHHPTRR